MRHRHKTLKLGRTKTHRDAMLANLVCSLIQSGRVLTTVQKAKAARSLADKMVTLAKKGTLHHRRQAISALQQRPVVTKLFTELGPRNAQRQGGYTRIIKAGYRIGDAAETAFLEWVEQALPATSEGEPQAAEATKEGAAPKATKGKGRAKKTTKEAAK